jgi:hypothetical protein
MHFSTLDYPNIPKEFFDEVLQNVPASKVSNVTDMLQWYLAEDNPLDGRHCQVSADRQSHYSMSTLL